MVRSGLVRSNLVWFSLFSLGSIRFVLVSLWPGSVRFGLAWAVSFWSDQVCSGLIRFSLVKFSFVWSGLVQSGPVRFRRSGSIWCGLVRLGWV